VGTKSASRMEGPFGESFFNYWGLRVVIIRRVIVSMPFASKCWLLGIGGICTIALLAVLPATHRTEPNTAASSATKQSVVASQNAQRVQASLGALPLAFEANVGQTDPQVKYLARGQGYTLFLTSSEAVFALRSASKSDEASNIGRVPRLQAKKHTVAQNNSTSVLHMQLLGGNAKASVAASTLLPGKTNYFIGNDPSKWHSDVAQYSRVSYQDVYPGINLAFHGAQRQLEFDFIVSPGANPTPIGFRFTGAQDITTNTSGDLVIASAAGNVMLHKPFAYQEENGDRQPVDVSFVLKPAGRISLALGHYDHTRELVIDPAVAYATYLGGTAEDDAYGVAFDGSGNVYVTGQTASTNFPTKNALFNTNAGAAGSFDVFVTKLNPTGSLLYSTYIGGSGNDSGNALAVDSLGDMFVAGGTTSSNFPTRPAGVFQPSFGGGNVDAFVLELNALGNALTFSTYLGGTGDDVASGIAIDGTGSYIVGSTGSTNFPTSGTAFQKALAGSSNGFVTKVNPAGTALLYSTYLGGGSNDFASAVAVNSGNAYVTGAAQNPSFPTTSGVFQKTCGTDGTCNGGLPDAFVTVFTSDGSALVHSTFLGGNGIDQGLGIAVDPASGNAYVTGLTQSADFPVQSASQNTFAGVQDAFVTQLKSDLSALVYSTFLGGSQSDAATSIALDGNKDAFVTGQTQSSDFPLSSATQLKPGGGNDAFVSELNAAGSLVFSTYLGGTQNENTNTAGANLAVLGSIAVDSAGANLYVAGNTASTDFPTVAPVQNSNGGGTDAFVVKYTLPGSTPDFSISATTPSAVNPGTSATSTVTLIALNGYNFPVNLSCTVSGGGTPAPSCSASGAFSTNPVTPTGGAGATSTLTITTTGSSGALLHHSNTYYAMWLPVIGLSVVGIGFSHAGSRRKKLLGLLMIATVMTALFLLPACSSGSKGGGGGGGGGGGTPAGSYTVTIKGTGTDARTITSKTTVTLTVN
jgi:hypothetical protein